MNLVEGDILYSDCAKAPSPLQDYHQIIVSKNEIVYRTWKISSRRVKSTPTEVRVDHKDFKDFWDLKNDIKRVFSEGTLDYIDRLAQGQYDLLSRMPRRVLQRVVRHLDLQDLFSLSQTSRLFLELCNSEELWKEIFFRQCNLPASEELTLLAGRKTWKKLSFTNLLQLRAQLVNISKSSSSQKDHHSGDKFSKMSLKNHLNNSKKPLKSGVQSAGDGVETNNRNLNNEGDRSGVHSRWSAALKDKEVDIERQVKSFLEAFNVAGEAANTADTADSGRGDGRSERDVLEKKKKNKSSNASSAVERMQKVMKGLQRQESSKDVDTTNRITSKLIGGMRLKPPERRFEWPNEMPSPSSSVNVDSRWLRKEDVSLVVCSHLPNKKSLLANKQLSAMVDPQTPQFAASSKERWPLTRGSIFYENMSIDEVLMTKAAKNNLVWKALQLQRTEDKNPS